MSEKTKKTRILLADAQHVVRQGIRQLLGGEPDFDIVGEAENGLDAVRLAIELMPDIVLMEARLPKLDGAEVIRRIKTSHPQCLVIVLTSNEEEEYVIDLLGAGIAGYLSKNDRSEQLIQSIKLIHAGEFVVHPILVERLYKKAFRHTVPIDSAEHLTHREMDVLKMAAKGYSNKLIATDLGISLRTVKGHFESIFDKMNVSSRTEAIIKALKQGLVTLEDE
jgi:two-component system, NarL family, response regulator LiaR